MWGVFVVHQISGLGWDCSVFYLVASTACWGSGVYWLWRHTRFLRVGVVSWANATSLTQKLRNVVHTAAEAANAAQHRRTKGDYGQETEGSVVKWTSLPDRGSVKATEMHSNSIGLLKSSSLKG